MSPYKRTCSDWDEGFPVGFIQMINFAWHSGQHNCIFFPSKKCRDPLHTLCYVVLGCDKTVMSDLIDNWCYVEFMKIPMLHAWLCSMLSNLLFICMQSNKCKNFQSLLLCWNKKCSMIFSFIVFVFSVLLFLGSIF